MTVMLDPRSMADSWSAAEAVRLSYDIDLPVLPNWNYSPCSRHEVLTASCDRCGVVPRRHQRVGITWLYLRPLALLADSTGLGKTVQAAGLLALLQANGELSAERPGRRALIVCRAATITQWRQQLARMIPGLTVTAVTGARAERAKRLSRPWEVALCGPEMIVSKTADAASQLAQFDIGTVICDDVEVLKNLNKTSRTIRALAQGADRVVIASATPMDKRLTQLYDLGATLLGWRSVFGNREEFCHRYVDMQQVWYCPKLRPVRCRMCRQVMVADHKRKMWVESKTKEPGPCPARPDHLAFEARLHVPLSRSTPGAVFQWQEKGPNLARIDEFRQRAAPLFLRRTAADCDDVDMPDVVPSQVWLELGPEQKKRYAEIRKGVLTRLAAGGKISRQEADNAWLRAWQVTSGLACLDESRTGESVKLDWAVQALAGDLAGEPVVVYCYFRPTLADLAARLDKAGIANVRIWGEQHASEQDSAIAAFNSGQARVMMITDAGGSGLNLQRARRMILVDTPRSAARVTQVIGRIKRDGSEHETVYVTQLLTDTPMEKALTEMVSMEAIAASRVLDGGSMDEWSWASEPERLMRAITG